MRIAEIVQCLEQWAPIPLQESYDNAGMIVGDAQKQCTGIICALDAVEDVVEEAIATGANLIVAHHPIVFSGLKKITGRNYVERTIIKAIKHDIAIYAIHTNLDNIINGVNGKMAEVLGLKNTSILSTKSGSLKKLYTFVPHSHAAAVREALFAVGAGQLGNYSECSFNTEGTGTFKANADASPYVGNIGEQHQEAEVKIEIVFPAYLESALIKALRAAHPYEEVAFDVVALANAHPQQGAGLIGELEQPLAPEQFLQLLIEKFKLKALKHTQLPDKQIKRIAICGGAGNFLINNALAANVDAFVTADLKYHEYFDADNRLVLVDIGHYESEQFTIGLLQDFLVKKFPTFAVLKTKVETNPVRFFLAGVNGEN